ncbi:MAG: glycosyltransferase family 2 protein [Granulosicoccus sp.]|nr:glycosyltransferase family 2 protein [Granulosicoccus sp.]
MSDTNETMITAVMTAHGEGALAGVSYKNMCNTVEFAQANGISVQKLLFLDRADQYTSAVFNGLDQSDVTIVETDFGDQGKVRNTAAEMANGEYIAFIDGDDLWSDNWLCEAHTLLKQFGDRGIAHPEFNWFFGGVSSVLINVDQESAEYEEDFLRHANYWDAMCMAKTSTHLAHPYCERRIKAGFAFEDWHWNCETVSAGFIHKVVPDTIHFKRRRSNSQTIEASGNRSMMPETVLTDFAKSA